MAASGRRSGIIRRLGPNRRGNTAIIFAIALLPIALAAGMAVDVRRQATSRSHLQDALDAAVLAAVKTYHANPRLSEPQRLAAAEKAAGVSMETQVRDRSDTILNVRTTLKIDPETGEAAMTGEASSPAAFGGLFGVQTLPFKVRSEAVAGGRPVEIALILDNTTSMFEAGGTGAQRFSLMRSAAKNYVDEVFELAGENAKVSVVPWTTLVNIKSEAVQAPDPDAVNVGDVPAAGSRRIPPAPYSDRLGVIGHPENAGVALSSATLSSLAGPVGWRGCVRSAPGEVSVSAGGAVTTPISDAAPGQRWPAALLKSAVTPKDKDQRYCRRHHNETYQCGGGGGGGGGGGNPPTPPPVQGSLDGPYEGQILLADFVRPVPTPWDEPNSLFQRVATCTRRVCDEEGVGSDTGLKTCITGFNHQSGTLNGYLGADSRCSTSDYWSGSPPKETGKNLACVSDPNEHAYLAGGGRVCPWVKDAFPRSPASNSPVWTSTRPISGPNLNCPTSILPLSGNRGQVLRKLNDMYPVPGGTLADVGLLWGLRTLSPQNYWTSFWGISDEDRRPAPWKAKDAQKIAILLTDGINVSPYNFEGYYGCTRRNRGDAGNCWTSGNVKSQSLSPTGAYDPAKQAANDKTANAMMLSACQAIREQYNVDLYVILVDVPDAAALGLARQCAPEAGHAFSVSSSELDEVFSGIMARTLRLTK